MLVSFIFGHRRTWAPGLGWMPTQLQPAERTRLGVAGAVGDIIVAVVIDRMLGKRSVKLSRNTRFVLC